MSRDFEVSELTARELVVWLDLKASDCEHQAECCHPRSRRFLIDDAKKYRAIAQLLVGVYPKETSPRQEPSANA